MCIDVLNVYSIIETDHFTFTRNYIKVHNK